MSAKIRGLRHLYANAVGAKAPPKLYKPFPNGNCLQCHGNTFKYLEQPVHVPMIEALRNNETSCIDCHGPVHPAAGEKS
jgi:nitrate/TMAO reductase-like tetraheme cytochrome c subunit